ncbi:MAG: radical SAM protein [Bdellovibrionales bacterium]|nr:radical SAM protein [Bdellovibrionales bacterium]
MVAIRMDASTPRIQTLKISITNESNIHPFYERCMGLRERFSEHPPTLLHTDVNKFVKIVGEQGIQRITIEGNEPLLRKDVSSFIKAAHSYKGIKDVRLVTNGTHLKNYADSLRKMGLKKVDIYQLDTLNFIKYQKLNGKDALYRVLDGIEKVEKLKYADIRLNILLLNEINSDEIVEIARLTRERKIHIRFWEFCPTLDEQNPYSSRPILTVVEAKKMIDNYEKLHLQYDMDDDNLAPVFTFEGGIGTVSFLSYTEVQKLRNEPYIELDAEGRLKSSINPKKTMDILSYLRKDSKDPKFRKSVEKFLLLKGATAEKKEKSTRSKGKTSSSSTA